MFYLPSGKIKEDIVKDLLSDSAKEIVGWYKYRKNSSIKPTFRDKLISKGLQKYFEKYHGKKTFVSCNLSSKVSSACSTHTIIYKFGKINCFDMYEYIEDVTANLGEKLTGYKKGNKSQPHCIFNKIVCDSNVGSNNTNDAILLIQEAVNVRLATEAKIAAKNECILRELEAEIKQMSAILADKLAVDLESAYNKILEDNKINREVEMAQACISAMKTPATVDILSVPNLLIINNKSSVEDTKQVPNNDLRESSPSPVIIPSTSKTIKLDYASMLKKGSETSTSVSIYIINLTYLPYLITLEKIIQVVA